MGRPTVVGPRQMGTRSSRRRRAGGRGPRPRGVLRTPAPRRGPGGSARSRTSTGGVGRGVSGRRPGRNAVRADDAGHGSRGSRPGRRGRPTRRLRGRPGRAQWAGHPHARRQGRRRTRQCRRCPRGRGPGRAQPGAQGRGRRGGRAAAHRLRVRRRQRQLGNGRTRGDGGEQPVHGERPEGEDHDHQRDSRETIGCPSDAGPPRRVGPCGDVRVLGGEALRPGSVRIGFRPRNPGRLRDRRLTIPTDRLWRERTGQSL